MKPFIHENFLLHSRTAETLYHVYAENMPIIDYHCHLPPEDVAIDRKWGDLAEIWLGGDHYKWRAMRSNGIDERLITGDAPSFEKFLAYAESMPGFMRNPLFDWSHLELARCFGIYDVLSPETAESIWERSRDLLQTPGFSARGFLERSNVRVICTTDDPTDTLEHHIAVRESGFGVRMLPAWRPDKSMAIDRPEFWNRWLDKLEAATDSPCCDFDDMMNALAVRHEYFHSQGCRLSDYGVEAIPDVAIPAPSTLNQIFRKVRSGGKATPEEVDAFRLGTLVECGHMDADSDWTWQLHMGAMRNVSSRVFDALGPDAGVDCISDSPLGHGLARLLDALDRDDNLPRTVLYNLNPRDNALLASLMGCFQRGPVAGKLQLGSGWWFNDQKHGMRDQIDALSELGLLSRFVGMLTDSRSFLSFPRHEYFRRILCDMLGAEIEAGDMPGDVEWVGGVIRDICFNNAVRYFNF